MAREKKSPATYADLERLPDNMIGEILDGELIASPRPASPHAYAGSAVGFGLGGPFQFGSGGPGGWHLLFEPELHLRADVVVPDWAGWRRERMPFVPHVAAFELAPDWTCEIVSPSTARYDRVRKRRIYEREGVRHFWLVDPIARTLEVLRLEGARFTQIAEHEGNEVVRAEPFDAIELELERWWLPEAAP